MTLTDTLTLTLIVALVSLALSLAYYTQNTRDAYDDATHRADTLALLLADARSDIDALAELHADATHRADYWQAQARQAFTARRDALARVRVAETETARVRVHRDHYHDTAREAVRELSATVTELNAYRYAMNGARYMFDAFIEDYDLRVAIARDWHKFHRTHESFTAYAIAWNTDTPPPHDTPTL